MGQRNSHFEEYDRRANRKAAWTSLACGAALLSDGYLNSVAGPVNTIFGKIYPEEYPTLETTALIPAIAFAGIVFGQLSFGFISDKYGRRVGMVAATIIVVLFSALCAGASYPTVKGMMIMFTVWRACLGVGIGAEYPAGSVAASEATAETKPGRRHALFIMVTNFVIDFGFVIGNMVPCILVVIFTESHLRAVWRTAIGLGCVPPLTVFYFRLKMEEPERYREDGMRNAQTPYALVIKTYWKRLLAVGGVWFLYNFLVYPFNMYSSYIIDIILPPAENTMVKALGYSTVIMLFYLPGSFLGAVFSDIIGPKACIVIGTSVQAMIGLLLGLYYRKLSENIGAFVVVYGLFLMFGEFGLGDNIGLFAAKSSATCVRGRFYGIAAATGKTGAFIGTYVFPQIVKRFGGADTIQGKAGPCYVACGLAITAALIAFFCLPKLGQDCLEMEDRKFRSILEMNGYQTETMGMKARHEEFDLTKSGIRHMVTDY